VPSKYAMLAKEKITRIDNEDVSENPPAKSTKKKKEMYMKIFGIHFIVLTQKKKHAKKVIKTNGSV